MEMDRKSIVGLVLILIIFAVWQVVIAPSPEELAAQQHYQDSIRAANQVEMTEASIVEDPFTPGEVEGMTDSARLARFATAFGGFATAAAGTAEEVTLANDLMTVTFNTKGGTIKRVELSNYAKVVEDPKGNEIHLPLYLLEDAKNRFEYILPVNGVSGEGIRTGDLYFTPQVQGNTLVLRAPTSGGGYFEQRYTLSEDNYLLDYDIRFEGLNQVLTNQGAGVKLVWDNYMDKIEKNSQYEANYSTLYFKPVDESTDYCSCTSSDTETLGEERLKWVAGSQQFFTAALIADESFAPGSVLATETFGDVDAAEDLKKVSATLNIPLGGSSSETVGMQFYVGPNDFDRLRAVGHELSDVISFGNSIFGAINRWVIRPMFKFLSGFISNMGIAILVLTLIVKLLLYPLTYKMLVSNMKMQVLKPELEKMKARFKDDPQAQQMEQMKMYQEYGASPLGGCLPMLLQMPIWFALYRFFPASIEFRQENFLWANDLSTYDVLTKIPEWIPFMQGHISLFAVLWAITTVIYAYYNSRHMDYSAQPMMKYFQYVMPILFLGFFNSFASGLTAYLFFSNTLNILQTIVTKNFLIDEDKLLAKLQENKKKPKKKSGFTARFQEALAEQQRQQAKKGQK
ncbi:membrane protein insertase YidC [Neolewinella lacunae]|uniref:Membrane protein insertase YidC n=1 Tax=Neolewinella lacunae TaxID=1517758 RepID=A0A923PFH4_9BACT|nr:membrane protein insertase YidC [Neolewinella lacunae]MBC6993107.1 membrane protein insertase YidC [Neolewinella lacunae]MDN3635927.1 membrane protein insertase YidC [Neolewinella lacunae]